MLVGIKHHTRRVWHSDGLIEESSGPVFCLIRLRTQNPLYLVSWDLERGPYEASGIRAQDLESLEVLTAYFAVAKRISLYLARRSPTATIDHLVHDISLMMLEDTDAHALYSPAAAAATATGSTVRAACGLKTLKDAKYQKQQQLTVMLLFRL